MRAFLRFFIRIFIEYPVMFPVLLGVAFLVGLLEGVGLSFVIPLLSMIGDSSPPVGSVSEDGFLGRIVSFVFGIFHINYSLVNVLILLFSVFVVQSGFTFLQGYFMNRLQTDFHKRLMASLYKGFLKANSRYVQSHKVGDFVNAIISETDRAASAVQFMTLLVSGLALISVYIILIVIISWKLTLVGLTISAITVWMLKGVLKKSHGFGVKISAANAELQSEVQDKITAFKFLKASSTTDQAYAKFSPKLDRRIGYRFYSLMNSTLLYSLSMPIAIGIICLCVFVATRFLGLTFPEIALFLVVFYRLVPKFQGLQGYLQYVLAFYPGLDVVDTYIEEARACTEIDNGVQEMGFEKAVIFENVQFSHRQINDLCPSVAGTLKGISLTIKKGQIVALVGPSGSGKSTIVDLVLRLYDLDGGQIYVDDTKITDINLGNWRHKIGYVSQDINLFHDTIRNNISWIVPDATLEAIVSASKMAYIHDFIMTLPEGYETVVGDRGDRLSGGQRQRIALARALLQNPDILILDEATSALDAESEDKISQAVDELSGSVTILIVAHRFSTIKKADFIYMIQSGEVVEEGAWDELMAKKGAFWALSEFQR